MFSSHSVPAGHMHTRYRSFRLPVRHIQVPVSAVLTLHRRDTSSDVRFRPHGTASVPPGSFHHRRLSPSIHQWICSPEVFRSSSPFLFLQITSFRIFPFFFQHFYRLADHLRYRYSHQSCILYN